MRRLWLILITPLLATASRSPADSFDFAYRISPLLAKVGCASAECHGASTGKGGFRLSLFAENPEADYAAILRELDGRRVDLAHPTDSLFLRKPARDGLRHGGGRLLNSEDFAFREFREWIAAGAPYRTGPQTSLESIRIESESNTLRAIGVFKEDGEALEIDVTPWTLWESSAPNLVAVDAEGQLDPLDAGAAWVFARFAGHSARWEYRRPFGPTESEPMHANAHPLDRAWAERLNSLGLRPGPVAPAPALLRRLSFDFLGRPPTLDELDRFDALEPETRIEKTIERLVTSPEFSTRLGQRLASFFEIPTPENDGRNEAQRNQRLREAFTSVAVQGQDWFELAKNAITDPGLNLIWRANGDPRDRAETVGRTLLGIRLGCARCHNHPLDRWTNADHLGFAALFTDPRPGPEGTTLPGRLFLPGSGQEIAPALLPIGADRIATTPPQPHRVVAEFLSRSAKPTVARNAANRIFGAMLGRGLVEPPDDHRLTNPASNPEAMRVLTETFLDMDGDLRAFLKWIATSRWYAVDSAPPPGGNEDGDPEARYGARRVARPLTPREWRDAVETALGVSLDLPTPPEAPLPRQLFTLNRGAIQEALQRPGNQVEALFLFESAPERLVRGLYRLILSRDPRDEELDAFLPLFDDPTLDPLQSGQDLAFALFASREFGSLR